MSYANPTRVRIGMHGTFGGKDFRVLGRVVMGESEEGETYYWNEFNLQAADGTTTCLVYEETERGGEWKLFRDFVPEYPMTAADAATKRVGDRLNLTDDEVRVTFRGSSRVFRIEGKSPEGVEVGDVAKYFNAEAPGIMQVVSWTGEEIEFYDGVKLTPLEVQKAFRLPVIGNPGRTWLSGSSSTSDNDSGSYLSGGKFLLYGGIAAIFLFIVFGNAFNGCRLTREASPAKHITAGPPPLMTGAKGLWQGANQRIIAHALMEIGEMNVVFERHEYELLDDKGQVSLLVCGLQPGMTNWVFFTPLAPYPLPTPQEVASQKVGDVINIDGAIGTVDELFQSTVNSMDNVTATTWRTGKVSFGYQANSVNGFILARWNNVGAQFFRGQTVSSVEFKTAFAQ